MENVNTYPFLLGEFKSLKQVIIEDNYQLSFGLEKKENGENRTFARMTSRIYPYELLSGGEFTDIPVYKQGNSPSASWLISTNTNGRVENKTIYLFLSNTTSYLNDSDTLPEDILNKFDSTEMTLSITLKNKENIYDILSECGAIFEPRVSYRQFAIVRSSIDGKLYQKLTELESEAGDEQIDPSEDDINWVQMIKNKEDEINTDNFMDISSKQYVDGEKIFNKAPLKSNISSKPKSNEIVAYSEIENAFLKLNATAVNSAKLDDLEASDIGGPSVNKAVIVKTNNRGKIDDSFLNLDIVSNEAGLVLKVSKTEIADNVNIFSSIQDAYDAASKLIKLSPVTIKVEDGIYSKNGSAPVLNLTNIYDNSMISIIGNESNPDNCIIQFSSSQQGLYFTGKGLYINGFKFVQLETEKGTSIGINASHGASMIIGPKTIISNCHRGISASGNSYIEANSISIEDCYLSVHSDASVVDVDDSMSTGSTYGCYAENNATIYANGFRCYKGSNQHPNTIGFIAEYNSVIRASETNIASGGMDKQYNDEESGIPNQSNGIVVY